MAAVKAYAFGPFELNPNRRILTRDGAPVPLAPKPFSLLLLLVRHAGQTLTKERLLKELWPQTVGTEANLSVNIATLRRALGEKPKDHRYIMTTPQRGYCFVAKVQRVSLDSSSRLRAPDPASDRDEAPPRRIAVLPFLKPDASEGERGLGEGLADSVSARIATLRGWAVQSPRTVLRHINRGSDAVTVGRRIGADAVLEGTITSSAERIAVEVKLLDTKDETLIWGDVFTETPGAVARIPRRIAATLTTTLEPTLAPRTRKPSPRQGAPALSSYQEYLKGRSLLNRADPESIRASLEHFHRAQELESSFALAFAGSAESWFLLWRLGLISSAEAVPAVESNARRALDLDGSLSDAYFWIAYLNTCHHWTWSVAETLFRLGLQQSPNSCLGRTLHAYFLLLAGDGDAALEEVHRAVGCDPLNLAANTTLGKILCLTGKVDAALDQIAIVRDIAPEFIWGDVLHGWALIQAGRYPDAQKVLERLLERMGDMPYTLAYLSVAHAGLHEKDRAEEYHRRLVGAAETGTVEPYAVAISHLGLGHRDQAVEWLLKAYRERDPGVVYLRLEPFWAPLRDDPRVLDIISHVGAPSH